MQSAFLSWQARFQEKEHADAARLCALALKLAPSAARAYRTLGTSLGVMEDDRQLAVWAQVTPPWDCMQSPTPVAAPLMQAA